MKCPTLTMTFLVRKDGSIGLLDVVEGWSPAEPTVTAEKLWPHVKSRDPWPTEYPHTHVTLETLAAALDALSKGEKK
jgi:hypothetical protein